MKPFSNIYFEIVGFCNAKCPHCTTGARRAEPGGIISPELFRSSLIQLLDQDIIEARVLREIL